MTEERFWELVERPFKLLFDSMGWLIFGPFVLLGWLMEICDSDGSGEADETGTGSAEGDSAGPQDIAQGIAHD